jgi:hypothetical protein
MAAAFTATASPPAVCTLARKLCRVCAKLFSEGATMLLLSVDSQLGSYGATVNVVT